MIFPASPKPASCKIVSSSPTFVSTAQNLRQIVSSRSVHRWGFELKYPPMLQTDFAPLWAFLNGLGGQFRSFDFVVPNHAPRGSMAGSPVISGAAQTGQTIQTSGWTPSTDDVLCVADFIRIGSSCKTYQILSNVSSDADGYASIQIHTPLQTTPSDGDLIIADAQFRCALAENNISVSVSTALHYGLTLKLQEVLY